MEIAFGVQCILVSHDGTHSPLVYGHMSSDQRKLTLIKNEASPYINNIQYIQYQDDNDDSVQFRVVYIEEALLSVEVYNVYIVPDR